MAGSRRRGGSPRARTRVSANGDPCQDGFWSLNQTALQWAAAAARQPYSMGLGPTVLSTAVATDATRARITASASDAAYGTNGSGRPAP